MGPKSEALGMPNRGRLGSWGRSFSAPSSTRTEGLDLVLFSETAAGFLSILFLRLTAEGDFGKKCW